MILSPALLFSYLFLHASITAGNLLGPRYPPPLDLSSHDSLVAQAWQNITDAFDGHLNGSAYEPLLTGAENVTFSTSLFSIHDPAVETLQYHYTSEEIRTATNGVNEVDADSIYRFASVSKLFTAYAAHIALTDEQLNTPFAEIFPELKQSKQENADNPNAEILYSPWDQVTPLTLAGHMSGVIGNSPPFAIVDQWASYAATIAADPTLGASAVAPWMYGLPPLQGEYPLTLQPTCPAADSSCTGDQYIHESRARTPTFQPWTSPSYSNHGLSLLGISIAALTGKTLDEVFQDALFTPLGMTSSYSIDPVHEINRSVIPGGGDPRGFFVDSGVAKASGGIYSTLSDLAKFSTSILNSTLMAPERTRRWLKPLSHTADPYFSIGAPWEIHRVPHSNGVLTDVYTKLGDSGPNGGFICVIPDYGAGFNLIDATNQTATRSEVQALLFDFIAQRILPALEAQAAAEAELTLTGTYASKNDVNSTLTLALDPEVPGLTVTNWISNSTDVLDPPYLQSIFSVFGAAQGLRLLPTIVEPGSGRYAFRVVQINNATAIANAKGIGPLTYQMQANWNWAVAGQATYAGEPLNLVYFEIDRDGRAAAADLPGFRIRLERED